MRQLTLKSASEQVYDHLLQAVFDRELKSGQKLVIEVVARQLGTSTTPVRDAFKKMEAQGLLEVRPRSGSYVKTPTSREIADVFQLRLILEQAAIDCGAEFSDEELARINLSLDRAEQSDRTADYIDADELLHDAIINRLDNTEVFNLTRVIWVRMKLFRTICGRDKSFDREALAEHRRLVAAMAAGEKPTLARLDEAHIRTVERKTVAAFDKICKL